MYITNAYSIECTLSCTLGEGFTSGELSRAFTSFTIPFENAAKKCDAAAIKGESRMPSKIHDIDAHVTNTCVSLK